MSKIVLNVPKELCAECSLALRRFVGGKEGVDSIDVENGKIESASMLRRQRRPPCPGFPKTASRGSDINCPTRNSLFIP